MSDEAPATGAGSPPALAWPARDLLACPECRSALQGGGRGLVCAACGQEWPEAHGWLDFRPPGFAQAGGSWGRRQRSMEDWYDNLLKASDQAEACFRHDFDPLAPLLAGLDGIVLDIGGGGGIARRYLAPDIHYIGIDPSPRWLGGEWPPSALPSMEPCSALTFVLGVGEKLPFRSELADAALVLFSINHAAGPHRLVDEARRVLRPGGRLVLTVEDTEPEWSDLARTGYRAGYTPLRRAIRDKLAASVLRRPWPIAADHVAVPESELRDWLSTGFRLDDRRWSAGYLLLDAVKLGG